MAGRLIAGGRLVTAEGVVDDGWLLVEDGYISALGSGERPRADETVEADGAWVVPGFVDIHCHGGGGEPFMSTDPARARVAVDTHARRGTTTLLASLVSRPIDELVNQISALRELVEDGLLAGVHLEGPFLSAARCGAHDPAILRAPETDAVERLLRAGQGAVRMVTLAPELDNSVNAVRQLVDAGSIAAIGHTDATEAQVMPAVDAGATVATHLFNGMRPLHHREPGPIGALLDDERVTVELICDLVHLSPTIVRLAAKHAGLGRTVLVTDAIAAAGVGDGSYDIGGLEVVVKDGVPTLAGGTSLAGSTLTMDVAFRNLVQGCGLTVPEAVAATSTRPAALLGLADTTGKLAKGLTADLVLLDAGLHVDSVMRRGSWVG
ncbi:N-acetylglucosamine-6-phosphate deacetylase [Actinokineospora globicatena]|uniref:N-acetylglucosamine-6-phosphate deacetylase n=1 Tax=Actinokineospora globicatena TaxID=103729 RepID=UPI0020A238C4|nr:N-acetylglucosamine-6-phosphate deacetylase [Actinokineospora globicatena]MCP2301413.1 N-acetylglucosamine-6-phosphate deacetylase [Actinokineospora globicatena]GLW76948.1 N-acetylglucosamine-6-phosphate deacetylase [Actinokineospora globicatena]GLW83781.1 N-acetylglucosamine-6-phosphate deacetylase [Actinokineospora globicatena]